MVATAPPSPTKILDTATHSRAKRDLSGVVQARGEERLIRAVRVGDARENVRSRDGRVGGKQRRGDCEHT